MMKMVVSSITGVILCLMFAFFMIPLLSTEHTATMPFFNSTDPDIAFANQMGTGFYMVIPFVPILVMLFIIFAYALRREM